MDINETKLNDFMGRFVGDLGAVMHAATIVVGDQLGLYKRLAEGPTDVESLARLTETDLRYLRKWLSAQAASGYVEYDAATRRFSLSEEQSFALAQEGSPAFIPGAFQIAVAQFKAIPKMMQAMRTGLGLGWAQARRSRRQRRHADPTLWLGGHPQHAPALPGAGRRVAGAAPTARRSSSKPPAPIDKAWQTKLHNIRCR